LCTLNAFCTKNRLAAQKLKEIRTPLYYSSLPAPVAMNRVQIDARQKDKTAGQDRYRENANPKAPTKENYPCEQNRKEPGGIFLEPLRPTLTFVLKKEGTDYSEDDRHQCKENT